MGNKMASKVDYWLSDDGLLLIKAWTRDGYTQEDICTRIGVSGKTFSFWKRDYPEIATAVREGREVVDYKVENALLKRALGYSITEVKTVLRYDKMKKKQIVERIESIEKEVAPDPTSIAIWLNNRKPDQWKRNRDNIVTLDDDNNHINVTIIKSDGSNQTNNQNAQNSKKSNALKESDIENEWNEAINEFEGEE